MWLLLAGGIFEILQYMHGLKYIVDRIIIMTSTKRSNHDYRFIPYHKYQSAYAEASADTQFRKTAPKARAKLVEASGLTLAYWLRALKGRLVRLR